MNIPPDVITIETAYSKRYEAFVGLRMKTRDSCYLLYAAEGVLHQGDTFVPEDGEDIIYTPVELIPTSA